MLSYKKYKQLNESLGFNLGISSKSNLGLMGSHSQELQDLLDEAKKKKTKKSSKKKSKKKMDGEMEIEDDEELLDDEDGAVEEIKDDEEVDDKEVDDEEVDDEEVDDEEVDDEEVDDEEVDIDAMDDKDFPDEMPDNLDKKGKIEFMKKYSMKKSMKKQMKSGKKKNPKKSSKKNMKSMQNNGKKKKCNEDFMSSLSDQLGFDVSQVKWDKNFQPISEDMLILTDRKEPQPGDVGYAPQGRIGD